MYSGTPPWDIGRPQKEFVNLESARALKGKILDSGCGTGENSLYLAGLGYEVVGADFSKRAIEKALNKSSNRKLKGRVKFILSDALNPSEHLTQECPFDTIIDCGLYHVFDTTEETNTYISNLRRLLKSGGTYFVMCFSDAQPGDWGPRRVPKIEFESRFTKGWRVNYVREAIFENNDPKLFGPDGAKAWLVSITKV